VFTVAIPTALAEPPELKALYPAGLQRGQTAVLKVIGKAGTAPVQAWCDRPGVIVAPAEAEKKEDEPKEGSSRRRGRSENPDSGLQVTVTAPADAAPGLAWLRLFNAEGASELRPFVIGVLPEVSEDEPNDALDEAQTVDAAGTVVNGVLDRSGQVDTFSVALQAGQTLVASVDANRALGSPMDAVLQVLSPRGFVVAQNDDDHGMDPLLVYTADAAGTHYVRVFAFPATPDSSIRFAGGAEYVYRLTVTTGPFATHLSPFAVPLDGEVAAVPGGMNVPEGIPALTVLGTPEGAACSLSLPGVVLPSRMLVVEGTSILEDSNGADGIQTVTLPVSVTGTIGSADEIDACQFDAVKGTSLKVQVAARSVDSPLDPVLRIRDANEKVLRDVDDASREAFDPETTFEVPEDGTYRVEVLDRYGHGGPRHFYVLSVSEERPDFAVTVEKDRLDVQAGKTLDVPVTVVPRGKFDGDVSLTVEGLPDGVTVAGMTAGEAPQEGQSRRGRRGSRREPGKAIQLKLEAAADIAFGGPIRIIGTTEDERPLRRTATAPAIGVASRSSQIWLTIKK
jgi:hypothetical protein